MSVSACPEPDVTSPLIQAIERAGSGHVHGSLDKARVQINKALKAKEKYANIVAQTLQSFEKTYGETLWPSKASTAFLIQLSDSGVGFASYTLTSRFSSTKEGNKILHYLGKAAEQNYPPAFFDYASARFATTLFDTSPLQFHAPKHKWLIYNYFQKAIALNCTEAKYELAHYIHLYLPEKKHQIPNLLLGFISAPDTAPSHREQAIRDLCVLGIGKAYQSPLPHRWCHSAIPFGF
ncbi:hypothetical protein [Terasakiella sp. SH-1]|uniref:hypothetical protein n=1 Tax=Terasakiella sp. SH-1 TaxID=2560057 RepID=UPI0010734B63|nr:hypothetical protein [Terasakiella sp. SH-1]